MAGRPSATCTSTSPTESLVAQQQEALQLPLEKQQQQHQPTPFDGPTYRQSKDGTVACAASECNEKHHDSAAPVITLVLTNASSRSSSCRVSTRRDRRSSSRNANSSSLFDALLRNGSNSITSSNGRDSSVTNEHSPDGAASSPGNNTNSNRDLIEASPPPLIAGETEQQQQQKDEEQHEQQRPLSPPQQPPQQQEGATSQEGERPRWLLRPPPEHLLNLLEREAFRCCCSSCCAVVPQLRQLHPLVAPPSAVHTPRQTMGFLNEGCDPLFASPAAPVCNTGAGKESAAAPAAAAAVAAGIPDGSKATVVAAVSVGSLPHPVASKTARGLQSVDSGKSSSRGSSSWGSISLCNSSGSRTRPSCDQAVEKASWSDIEQYEGVHNLLTPPPEPLRHFDPEILNVNLQPEDEVPADATESAAATAANAAAPFGLGLSREAAAAAAHDEKMQHQYVPRRSVACSKSARSSSSSNSRSSGSISSSGALEPSTGTLTTAPLQELHDAGTRRSSSSSSSGSTGNPTSGKAAVQTQGARAKAAGNSPAAGGAAATTKGTAGEAAATGCREETLVRGFDVGDAGRSKGGDCGVARAAGAAGDSPAAAGVALRFPLHEGNAASGLENATVLSAVPRACEARRQCGSGGPLGAWRGYLLIKKLNFILRHGAALFRLPIREDGFVRARELLALPCMRSITWKDLQDVSCYRSEAAAAVAFQLLMLVTDGCFSAALAGAHAALSFAALSFAARFHACSRCYRGCIS